MHNVFADFLAALTLAHHALRRFFDPQSELDKGDVEIVQQFARHLERLDLDDLHVVNWALMDAAQMVQNTITKKTGRTTT